MIKNYQSFSVHNHYLAPSYSVPAVDLYQSEKNIQVVSGCFSQSRISGHDLLHSDGRGYFESRLKLALGLESTAASYFPGAVIPGPGGAACGEQMRGNLLFNQFLYMLDFDGETTARLFALSRRNSHEEQSVPEGKGLSFSLEAAGSENWCWKYIAPPALYFLHQKRSANKPAQIDREKTIAAFRSCIQQKWREALSSSLSDDCLKKLLALISGAWFKSDLGLTAISWGQEALEAVRQSLLKYKSSIDGENILPFLFELEAMASYLTLGESKKKFGGGVFAGNYVEVALAPLTTIKATEFCVSERLFDEVINLSSRGFAPIIINEYGLIADGNHRLTAAYIWNILKYTQDLEWCLDNEYFQSRVANFATAVEDGLLEHAGEIGAVSLHQVLAHLANFLSRPEWRARLNTYTKPLLKRHHYICELPVVVLPEYLSGAVVKAEYDKGIATLRACPSIYEAMSLNPRLVLPPRASYHFTDAALLPWFTVLKNKCGTKRPVVRGSAAAQTKRRRRI